VLGTNDSNVLSLSFTAIPYVLCILRLLEHDIINILCFRRLLSDLYIYLEENKFQRIVFGVSLHLVHCQHYYFFGMGPHCRGMIHEENKMIDLFNEEESLDFLII
jgi:hypothetical protein